MTVTDERNIFLKEIEKYYQNIKTRIPSRNTYNILKGFNIENKKIKEIPRINLINIQLELDKMFKDKAHTLKSKDSYFWGIENRNGMSDKEFYDGLADGIKLYVSVDTEKLSNKKEFSVKESEGLYEAAKEIFDFVLENNISMQATIAKNTRSDAFIIRVVDKEKVPMLIEKINSLNYKPNIKPNPFSLNIGKVNITIDGRLSYNEVLSDYINSYLIENRTETLNVTNFTRYLKKELELLISDKERLETEEKTNNTIKIIELMIKNLENTLTLEELLNYVPQKNKSPQSNSLIHEDTDKKLKNQENKMKIIDIINKLKYHYEANLIDDDKTKLSKELNIYNGLDYAHIIVENYLETENINYFTKKYDIRKKVDESFTKEVFKETISDMIWIALVEVSKETYKKYGKEQLNHAIKELIEKETLSSYFTNNKDARSYLGFIASPILLTNLICEKNNIENLNKENKKELIGKILCQLYNEIN